MSGEQKTAEQGKIRLGDLLLNAGFEIVNRDKEIAALKEALKELIPIAKRMQATCEDGESKCYDNEWDAADAIEYKAAIDSAKKLLNKQPQSESDGDKNL